MYERFYGLTRTPFAVTPDPAMLFMSKVHREALATIIYGVETRKGFIVCTGEVGTGKSTIIRAFFDQALADAVKLIYIFTPQVSPLEIAKYICREMAMADPDSIFAAVPVLQMKLLEMFEAGKTVVLMIDEAQLLPPETLEFLRLLSNFETDTEKLIQIVLVGQPEVDTMLARRDMRQVNQRVALRARLAPLSVEESFDYIDHRIRISGAAELAQVLSPSAAWLIAEAAGGIPRVINILSDNVMIAGFGAAQRPIGSHLAGNTVREFLGKSGPAKPAPGARLAGGWRAAMRLRGALAREKDETEDWVPAGPPEAPAPPRAFEPPPIVFTPAAPPHAPAWPEPSAEPTDVEVASAAPAPPGSILVEPVARPLPVRPPPVMRPPPVEASEPTATIPATLEPVIGTTRERPPAPAPIFVEPTFEPPIAEFGFGIPVPAAELVRVAPTAASDRPPPIAQALSRAAPRPQPAEVPAHPSVAGPPVAPPPPPKPPPPMPVLPQPIAPPPVLEPIAPGGRPSLQPRRRIPPPLPRPYYNGAPGGAPGGANGPSRTAPANQPAQWPALSRIRSGLPPRRDRPER